MTTRYTNTAFTYTTDGVAVDPGQQGQIIKADLLAYITQCNQTLLKPIVGTVYAQADKLAPPSHASLDTGSIDDKIKAGLDTMAPDIGQAALAAKRGQAVQSMRLVRDYTVAASTRLQRLQAAYRGLRYKTLIRINFNKEVL